MAGPKLGTADDVIVGALPAFRSSTRRRRPSARRLAIAVASGCVAIAVAACGGSSSHVAKLPALSPDRPGPESMYTMAAQLLSDPTGSLDQLQRLGAGRVHVYMSWSSLAPDPQSPQRPSFDATDPAAYASAAWAPYDAVVRGLAARHMGIDLALAGSAPRWAEAPGTKAQLAESDWKPNAADYGEWVRAVATRYSGHYTPPGQSSPLPRVNFWSIWNEPNLGTFLAPETPHGGSPVEVAPRLYRGLVDAAWTALHATGHGADTILIGEMAPTGVLHGVGVFNVMPPLRFLRALYCVDSSLRQLRGAAATARGCPATAAGAARFAAENPALFHATGFADHPYPQGLPPDQHTPDSADDAELVQIPNLERLLDRVNRIYGSSTRFPIWSTEFGYVTRPPNTLGGAVPVARAALYLNWAEYITWQNPRIKSYDQYLLNDPPTPNGFVSGLKTAAGKPKPTLDAYRMPLYLPVSSTAKGHPLVVWGQVRPAPGAARQTGHAQMVQIQFRSGSSGAFKTLGRVRLTGPNGYFEVHQRFPSSGQVRLRWAYPDGQTVFSRTAAVTIS